LFKKAKNEKEAGNGPFKKVACFNTKLDYSSKLNQNQKDIFYDTRTPIIEGEMTLLFSLTFMPP